VDVVLNSSELTEANARQMWLERSWTLSVLGRFSEAIDAASSGLKLNARRDLLRGQLQLQIARAETEIGLVKRSIKHAAQAVESFRKLDDLRGLATALRILGRAHEGSGDLESAANCLSEGLALARRIGSVEEIGGCLINLGLVERRRGDLEAAIACDRGAIAEFERIGHGAGRATGYGNLADGLLRLGRLDEALAWCDKALDAARSINHETVIADVLLTAASAHLQQGQAGKAQTEAETAADLFTRLGLTAEASECAALAAKASGKKASS
jgi:tetratricopeptide (TPR) repeat protein